MPSFQQIVIIAAMAASSALASPLMARDSCNVAPSASGSQTPLSQPSVTTAELCKEACEANASCKSFVFGLPADASAPTCQLYSVPAAQVPTAGTNLHVWDVACADSQVPTTAPTQAAPQGQVASTGSTGQTGQTGSTGQNNQNGQTGQNGQKAAKRDVCGSAPTGPSTSAAPTPLKTDASIANQADCLALCKQTSGCQSVEFGTFNGASQCRLFQVPASQLPPATDGQSFVAFDQGC